MQYPLIVVRSWRTIRQVPRQALRDWRKAFLNEGQFISLALAGFTSWIGLEAATLPQLIDEANGWVNVIQAAIYVGSGWAALCFIRAPHMIRLNERKLGRWERHHFIFHQPRLVATARLTHMNGATQAIPLAIDDFEKGAMVYLTVETTPSVAGRVLVMPVPGAPKDDYQLEFGTTTGGYAGTRVSKTDGELTLYVKIKPKTVPLTIRAYCNQFYVGKDDESYL